MREDWAWRARLRSNRHTHLVYRMVVALVGLVVVVIGFMLVPLPGPGWLIVIAGLLIWASEFEWAQRVLHRLRERLHRWNTWVTAQPWYIQGVFVAITGLTVLAVLWLTLALTGVPTYLPGPVVEWLGTYAGLSGPGILR